MPIEIRELVIKTTIDDSPLQNSSKSTAGAGFSKAQLLQLKKDIIRECVDQIIERLDDKSRRI